MVWHSVQEESHCATEFQGREICHAVVEAPLKNGAVLRGVELPRTLNELLQQ